MTTDEKLDAILSRTDAIEERTVHISAITAKIMDALNATRSANESARAAPAPSAHRGANLPNYGRAKGQPIHGATADDLAYYAAGARRSLDDPGKARWHDNERALLAAIEREQARQAGDPAPPGPLVNDDDLPF